MQSNYLVISEHGLAFEVKPEPEMSNLEFLQTIVGGWIERIPVNLEGVDCWVNEEGLVHGLGLNMTAGVICNHMMAGTAVFAGYDNGESAPAPDSFIKKLKAQGLAIEKETDLKDVMAIIKLDNEGAQHA